MKPLIPLAALAATFVIGGSIGCQTSTSPSSSSDDPSSVSSVAGEAVTAANLDMQTADSLRHGPCGAFGLPLQIPSGCDYDAASLSFLCGPETLPDGLTRSRSYQFLDGAGAAQSAYDASTTASIHFASSLSGTATHEGNTVTVSDSRSLVETGLAGDETTRIFNGGGHAYHQGSFTHRDGQAVTVTDSSSSAIADVVVPSPFERTSWPLSGTITTHFVSSGDGVRPAIDRTSVLTFNGTQFVTLAFDDGTSTTINLAHPPHRGPGRPHGRGGPGQRRHP